MIGLLVAECLLWLSEWFRCFPKGYPVLTALATVCAGLLLLILWFAASVISQWNFHFSTRTLRLFIFGLLALEALLRLGPRRLLDVNSRSGQIAQVLIGLALFSTLYLFATARLLRRRFQFTIRSLLIMVVVAAVPCSWLTVEVKEAKRQREAVAAINNVGTIYYNWQLGGISSASVNRHGLGPEWLLNLLGVDFFVSVGHVYFYADVPAAGLENLKRLNTLQYLDLSRTKVTDEDVKMLQQALPNCRIYH
ncbi:MAG: hypothetical protein ACLP9L_09215 [Thermoguttaceae bacterium]